MATLLRHDQRQPADVPLSSPEVSVVIPCLNECETLGDCIRAASLAMDSAGIVGELVVADNGSTDGSPEIAIGCGARVVHVPAKGYGNALRGGIEAAKGQYVVMGDADKSYDFSQVPRFVRELQSGHGLVMGNRFAGRIHRGAMPWLHRYLGNPVLSFLGRTFFGCRVGDFHCGLRAFSKEAFVRMNLRTTGMEFASEMVIKSALLGIRTSEIPIELYPDGRTRRPHLRTWRDGWRHLKFMLLMCPTWLYRIPGICLFSLALIVGTLLVFQTLFIGAMGMGIHTLLVCGIALIVGQQLLIFASFTERFSILLGLRQPATRARRRLAGRWTLEFGLFAGLGSLVFGVLLLAWNAWAWQSAGFGPLDPQVTMRSVIPAVTCIALGTQVVFGSFFLGFLKIAEDHLDAAEH